MTTEMPPNSLQIRAYMHCGLCLDERPTDVSPAEWARLSVGYTERGFQVWCHRHDVNVLNMDLTNGRPHPANTTRASEATNA